MKNDHETAEVLAAEVAAGSARALARALTWIEKGGERAVELTGRLYGRTGKACIVGVTGSPGSGKSTLTRALARAARSRGKSVGILAIDPSSPFSGGAILGDRIRMGDIALDEGVFVRSIASRGAQGGLSRSVSDAIDLMDAAGKNLIIVETVGTGQDEIDVMAVVETVVLVSVPGMGDDIQTLKAGILEIADIHVVNKSDREGASRAASDLLAMIALGSARQGSWTPPVITSIATREEGSEQLLDAILEHRKFLAASGEQLTRQMEIAKARVLRTARDLMGEQFLHPDAELERMLALVAERKMPPHDCARAVLAHIAEAETNPSKR